MKIFIVHNQYQQLGGEDAVVQAETQLLQDHGDEVIAYRRSNQEIKQMSWGQQVLLLGRLSYMRQSYLEMVQLIKRHRPDIAHFHNIFYMMSPSVYAACQDQKVPVVQSLHNFRPLCSNGLFFREGHPCEDCQTYTLWQGVKHRCFRQSYFKTAAMAWMLSRHQRARTWQTQIDGYITATNFTKDKYVEAGFPAEKFYLKPHFMHPAPEPTFEDKGYGLYIGRLSQEKGVEALLKMWQAQMNNFPLKIMGDGPLAVSLKAQLKAGNCKNIEMCGFVREQAYEKVMQQASFIIVPSLCYENFPRIVAEAFAFGKSVIVSRLGSLAEIIEEGQTGLLFNPHDLKDLAAKVEWMISHAQERQRMQHQAREFFDKYYSADVNYHELKSIYKKVMARYDS